MKTSDKVLTFTALFISCLALVVSIVQTNILQKQSAAAVWPRVDVLSSYGSEHYKISMVNQGVGPAIISNVEYVYKDTMFNSIVEIVKYFGALESKKLNRKIPLRITYSEVIAGRVIKSAESIDIYNAIDSAMINIGFEYFHEVDFNIDYCSIYETCWRNQDDEIIELD